MPAMFVASGSAFASRYVSPAFTVIFADGRGELDPALGKLVLRLGDLAVEIVRLRLLRRDHEEPRGREQGDGSDGTERDHRLLLLQQAVHQEPPVFRSAAIWKWTTDFVPFVSTLLDVSVTLLSVGRVASRASKRATSVWA